MRTSLSIALSLIASLALFSGCGSESSPELKPGDVLYGNAHLFANTHDGDALVQLHLFNLDARSYGDRRGPLEMNVLRGNDSAHYYLKLAKIIKDKKLDNAVNVFSILPDESASSAPVGEVSVFTNCYFGDIDSLQLCLDDTELSFVHFPISLSCDETLLEDMRRYECDSDKEIRLIASLYNEFQGRSEWSIADKNLVLFLHLHENPSAVDYAPMEKDWHVTASADRNIISFWSLYYGGGNGRGSTWPVNLLYYKSEGVGHVATSFEEWAFDSEIESLNLYYPAERRIISWGEGHNKLYLFDFVYYDEYYIQRTDMLAAFWMVDGNLIPAEVIKPRGAAVSKISFTISNCSEDTPVPRYKVDESRGILGVPLIDSNDDSFHDKYLIYNWNARTCQFEYNGRIEQL